MCIRAGILHEPWDPTKSHGRRRWLLSVRYEHVGQRNAMFINMRAYRVLMYTAWCIFYDIHSFISNGVIMVNVMVVSITGVFIFWLIEPIKLAQTLITVGADGIGQEYLQERAGLIGILSKAGRKGSSMKILWSKTGFCGRRIIQRHHSQCGLFDQDWADRFNFLPTIQHHFLWAYFLLAFVF